MKSNILPVLAADNTPVPVVVVADMVQAVEQLSDFVVVVQQLWALDHLLAVVVLQLVVVADYMVVLVAADKDLAHQLNCDNDRMLWVVEVQLMLVVHFCNEKNMIILKIIVNKSWCT